MDSPAGLAGWILEKFWSWTDRSAHPEDYYSRDQLLDNVSLYWFTATGASSARLYWESFGSFSGGEVAVPSACSIFPNEIFRASRRWASKRYTDIRYWNEPEVGGHFAAFEAARAVRGRDAGRLRLAALDEPLTRSGIGSVLHGMCAFCCQFG